VSEREPERARRAPESFTTRRLRLRRPTPADAEAVFRRYASDPAVTRIAHCHPDHLASQRVLEKCGFRVEEREYRTPGFPNLDATETRDALRYARVFGSPIV